MNDEHLYEKWKQRRRQIAVPEDFSDRVMAGLFSNPAPRNIQEEPFSKNIYKSVHGLVPASLRLVSLKVAYRL
jgi:hypothetical protein